MALAATGYPHITLRDDGAAVIAGTTMKVTELVAEMQAYGWSPEELHFQHPDIALGQIHSALAYYWDHRDTLDRELAQAIREADERRAATGPSAFAARLKRQTSR
jgi:uncharacterized protein (DUF433 family)